MAREGPSDEQIIAEASPDGMLGKVLGLSHTEPYKQVQWAKFFARNVADMLKEDSDIARLLQTALLDLEIEASPDSPQTQQLRAQMEVLVARLQESTENHIVLMRQLPVAVRAVLSADKVPKEA